MIVTDAINLLKNTELKQLAIKDDKPGVIGLLNLGVLEIHKRFVLWEAEATLNMVTDVLTYKLDGIDPNVTIDLSDHDLLMIEEVYYEDGSEIPLNDENDTTSVATPKYHTIELVESTPPDVMYVIYRASPIFMKNEKETINLPPQFLEALFFYVAFKAHGSIKTEGPSQSYAYYKQFERSLASIKENGLFAQDSMECHKFVERGYA